MVERLGRLRMSTPVDVLASYKTFADESGYEQCHAGLTMWKTVDDLARYRSAIEGCRPQVLVETGTRWGGFAAWVADTFGVDVVTVDHERTRGRPKSWPGVTFIEGDSVSDDAVGKVAAAVGGRRCVVSLDSDHHAPHVEAEIEAYAPLVSPGCYLVVEDGLADLLDPDRALRFGRQIPEVGGPLRAVEATVATWPGWRRDLAVEGMSPASHHPGGWWVRDG